MNSSSNTTSLSSSSTTTTKPKKKKPTNTNTTPNNNTRLKLSTDPQSVAARERRHRISDRFKILQSLVPGGTKMDTVSMLEEAIHYVKFLKAQIWLHQNFMMLNPNPNLPHPHPPPSDFLPSSSSTAPVLPPHFGLHGYDDGDENNINGGDFDYGYGDYNDGNQETMCLDEWYFKY